MAAPSNRPADFPEESWSAECERLYAKCKERYPSFELTVYRPDGGELRIKTQFIRNGATYANALGGDMDYETKQVKDVKLSERNVRQMLEMAERDMDMAEGKDV